MRRKAGLPESSSSFFSVNFWPRKNLKQKCNMVDFKSCFLMWHFFSIVSLVLWMAGLFAPPFFGLFRLSADGNPARKDARSEKRSLAS